jgi:hypothetical protein
MEKQTLYDFLRELVDDGKGDIIYKLLDCDVVINDTKR